MTLTRPLIDALRTRGAFTTATITALGLEWDTLMPGWPDALIGREICADTYREARAGRERAPRVLFKDDGQTELFQ